MQTSAQACLGGSVFNFCIAAQRQGMQTLYVNALSQDSFGQQFVKVLAQEGVRLDAPQPVAQPTSMAIVQLDAQGKASYSFLRKDVADTARPVSSIIENWRSATRLLHTGCLMLMPEQWPQTRELIAHALAQGCMVSVDANLRLAVCPDIAAYASCVLQACSLAHVVKVSDDDLVALGWLKESEQSDMPVVIHAARQLFQQSSQTQLIALTLGEHGAWLITHEHEVFQSTPPNVKVVDTVGAGDSFTAALLAYFNAKGWLTTACFEQGVPLAVLESALRHAASAAAVCVQRMGCDPASWVETELMACTIPMTST